MRKPVLFRVTNNLRIGGVQRRLRALLPLLTQTYDVHVVTYKDKGIFYEELATCGVHTHFLPRRGHWNPRAIWRLAGLFLDHKADIVHTHSFGGNIFGILAAALAHVPVRVAQVHLSELHWYGKTAFRRKKQVLEERLVHSLFTDRIVFVSQESRDHFHKNTKLDLSKLTILHNGLALPDCVQPVPRAELGIPEHKRLVGFVGRLTKGKGLEFYLDLVSRVVRERPGRFHFVVIGGGDGLEKRRQWATERGLDHDLSFLGERQDIHRYYAALDCLAFCSEPGVEGMPGVVLEAAAHGLPILARPSAPIREISHYYSRIALLDDSRSPAEHLQATMDLPPADTTALRTHFSIEAMHRRTLALYAELTRQNRS